MRSASPTQSHQIGRTLVFAQGPLSWLLQPTVISFEAGHLCAVRLLSGLFAQGPSRITRPSVLLLLNMRAFCRHTRKRFEPTHGDVLTLHTGFLPPRHTHHTHHTPHTTDTTQHTTQHTQHTQQYTTAPKHKNVHPTHTLNTHAQPFQHTRTTHDTTIHIHTTHTHECSHIRTIDNRP